ncbi:MAG: MFS transporter, partial [Erysipelotrichaceae bacterium]
MKTKGAVVVLALVTLVTVIEMNVVMPLAPALANVFDIAESKITLLNIGYAAMGLLAPLFGFSADKYGLRKVLTLSMGIFLLGCLTMSNATSGVDYFVARSIIGLSYYSIISLIASYTGYLVSEDQLGVVSGIYKIAFGIAILISPLLGSYIMEQFDFRMLYALLSVASLVCIIALTRLPNVNSVEEENISMQDVTFLLTNKTVWTLVLVTLFVSVPSILFYNYYSIFLSDLGYTQMEIGSMYTVVSSGSVLAGILIILLSDKFGKAKMAIIGILMSTIFILPLANEMKVLLWICSFLFGLGYDLIWGLHFPICSMLFKKESGTFLALLSLAMAFTNVLTNMVAPLLHQYGGFAL